MIRLEDKQKILNQQQHTACWTSIKRPTLFWRPAAKVPEKLTSIHYNKNLYLTATSKQPRPAFYRLKSDFGLFCTSIKRPGRFEVARFKPDEGKRMTMWITVKTHFQQYSIKTITKKVSERFSLFVQHTSQCCVDRHVASVQVIVSLDFVNIMDRIITIIVIPPNSDTFSYWRRTCHVPWVKTH